MNDPQPPVRLHRRPPAPPTAHPGRAAAACGDGDAELRRRIAVVLECSARYLLGPEQAAAATPALRAAVSALPLPPARAPSQGPRRETAYTPAAGE